MAEDSSPEEVSERLMFASADAPMALPRPVARVVAHDPGIHDADRKTPPGLSLRRTAFQSRRDALLRSLSISGIATAAQTEIDSGTAFVLVPIPLAVGALSYFTANQEPALEPLVVGAICLLGLVVVTRSRPPINLMLAGLLLIVVGALCGQFETWRSGTKMLGAEITTQLVGRVVAIEPMSTGRVRLTIGVISTARPVLRYAPDRVRVSARSIPPGLVAGSTISGLVRLMPPSGPVRPGSYDFSFQSYFAGIGASGFFLRGPDLASVAVDAGPLARFHVMVERWRGEIADRIVRRIGGSEGQIAAALVVGVRAGIPDEVNDALRRAGIYHIISISGLHMALVAGTIMGLMRVGFGLFPGFSSRHPVKKYASAVAIVGIAVYLFISGAEVAAKRSFIMLAVMLTAVLFDRAALTLRNLAISAILVIALSPHEVSGPSFQMSFAATAALVGAYAAWSDYRLRRPSRGATDRSIILRILRKGLAAMGGLAMTSLVAGGATAIYAAYHFQQMPSLGLFTNLAAMPVVSTLVMPFAVIAALAMPFGLDGPFLDVMGMGLSLTVAIARWFSERSPIDIVGPIPSIAVITLTAALTVATVFTTWLRAFAMPLVIVGLLMLPHRVTPDLLVSEDARLLGLSAGRGEIAVNRKRPNQFTVDNWQRAMLARSVVPPDAGNQPAGSTADRLEVAEELSVDMADRFVCSKKLCIARHISGAIVVHSSDRASAASLCDRATVIVIDDATAKNLCSTGNALVITRRDLARWGSAEVKFKPRMTSPAVDRSRSHNYSGKGILAHNPRITANVHYAITQPYRPWHLQRRFSREARGLAPYSRPKASVPHADSRPAGAVQRQ